MAGEPVARLVRDVAAILEETGPLREDELLTQLRIAHGAGRLGSLMRDAAVRALRQGELTGAVHIRWVDEVRYVWPAGMAPESVPVRVPRGGQARDAASVVPEEAARAVGLAAENAGGIPHETIPGLLKETFSLPQVNERVRALAERAVRTGVELAWLVREGDVVRAAAARGDQEDAAAADAKRS
jgi:hypothetical protein